jgi:hypothetical protein
MSQYLTDPDYLFNILTIIVKKSGGEIKLTKTEIESVTKGDVMGMYYEPKTDSIILKAVDPEDMLAASKIIKNPKSEVYEN